MQSILTLTLGEFELVHDLFSLLIIAMGASSLFFLLSRKQVAERFQPLLLIAGIVALIGCYHAVRFFNSWNEAFELAGNSYVASGHFFHGSYRYGDWVLTMPLLLIDLVLVLGLPQEKTTPLLKRLIGSALATVFFTYCGASYLGDRMVLVHWSCWALSLISFLYMAWHLVTETSLEAAQEANPSSKLFLTARNLFLLSWAFFPLATFVMLCSHNFGTTGLVMFFVGASIADLISKCGVSFYLYRIMIAQGK